MQTELAKPDYFWGLTHGDFHPGQLTIAQDGSGDLVALDWEFAGIYGNPAIDLATWNWSVTAEYMVEPFEDEIMRTYYLALIDGGVNPIEYPFEKLISDYRTYGFAQIVARFIGFSAAVPAEIYPAIFS